MQNTGNYVVYLLAAGDPHDTWLRTGVARWYWGWPNFNPSGLNHVWRGSAIVADKASEFGS